MKTKTYYLISLSGIIGVMMSACSNDTIEYQEVQYEEYMKNFIEEFGIPASGHT